MTAPDTTGRREGGRPVGPAEARRAARPAGPPPRTWTVELPPGLPLLNANRRVHWRKRAELTKTIREAAYLLAQGNVPALQRARIVVEYRPPDRRRRDAGNLAPSAKAAVDGLVDAGVLPDDSDDYLIGPDMRRGDVTPQGQLILHITELETETTDGDR